MRKLESFTREKRWSLAKAQNIWQENMWKRAVIFSAEFLWSAPACLKCPNGFHCQTESRRVTVTQRALGHGTAQWFRTSQAHAHSRYSVCTGKDGHTGTVRRNHTSFLRWRTSLSVIPLNIQNIWGRTRLFCFNIRFQVKLDFLILDFSQI